jgi:hypothetical protein
MFELINQMRTEEPSPIGPVGDLFPPGSQESKKVIATEVEIAIAIAIAIEIAMARKSPRR